MPEGNTPDLRQRERLRRSFRPADVRLLFIGESPPASGRFFYQGNSGLYRAIRETFRAVDPSIGDAGFLAVFQSLGCYLIDLCPEPVDHLDLKSRRAACRASEESLSWAIGQLRPVMIATVVRSIEGNVMHAALRAGWRGPFIHLPYPGRWSRFRNVFVDVLAPVINGLLQAGTPQQCHRPSMTSSGPNQQAD